MMQSCEFFPPDGGGNGGRCGNDHCKVTAVTMTMTTTVDADADADARSSSSSSSSSCCSSSGATARGGEYQTSKEVCGAGIGSVGKKQRPGNGGDNNRGGIVPAAGECGGDPDRAALPPLLPPFPPAR